MSKKNALLTTTFVVVVVGGFLLWNTKEPTDSFTGNSDDGYPSVSSDDSVALTPSGSSVPVAQKTTSTSKTTTSVAPKVVVPTRVLENGQYVNIVSLTNTGFVPPAITIAKGESVRFVNRSGNAMRIISTGASAEHSGLTQEKSVGFGGTYSLTFPKTGTYAFGNGKASSFVGVVNVQ